MFKPSTELLANHTKEAKKNKEHAQMDRTFASSSASLTGRNQIIESRDLPRICASDLNKLD